MRFKFVRNATLATILEISIEGNRSSSRMKGRRITFIYSLYHDHSIKRSVSSRDDRSSHWQHPHVVSQSFAICGNCRGGLRITEGLESRGSLQSRTSLDSLYISIFPASSPFVVHRFSHPEIPSFLPFFPFLSFFFNRSFSIQTSMFILNFNLGSMRFLVQVKLFRGKIERISLFIFLFLQT